MEVLLATLLFIVLSPGLIFTIPPGKGGVMDGESTSNLAVLVHAVLFFIAQKLTASNTWPFNYLNQAVGEIRSTSGSKYIIAPIAATLAFIVLSPGFIIQLPPDEGSLFFSQTTDVLSVLVHGVIYFVVMKIYASNGCPCNMVDGVYDGSVAGSTGTCANDTTSGVVPWLNCQLSSV